MFRGIVLLRFLRDLGFLLLVNRLVVRGPFLPTAPLCCQEIAHMVELTDAARQQLDGYFADKEKAPIRIYLSAGG